MHCSTLPKRSLFCVQKTQSKNNSDDVQTVHSQFTFPRTVNRLWAGSCICELVKEADTTPEAGRGAEGQRGEHQPPCPTAFRMGQRYGGFLLTMPLDMALYLAGICLK